MPRQVLATDAPQAWRLPKGSSVILGIYWGNSREMRNYCNIKGYILGLYWGYIDRAGQNKRDLPERACTRAQASKATHFQLRVIRRRH